MEQTYFVIPSSKLQVVESKRSRLIELFEVQFSVQQGGSFQDSCSDSAVRILLTHTFPSKDGSKSIQKARAYIQSLTGLCEDHCTCIESYDHELYTILQAHHNDIERESQAVLYFAPEGNTIQISGQSFSVAIAKSVMEHLRYSLLGNNDGSANKLLVATTNLYDNAGGGGQPCLPHGEECYQHTAVIHTLSPGGESSHDSCYDSDCSPTSSRRNSSHRLDADLHTDISRTTSDTLGEELIEDLVKPSVVAVPENKSEQGSGKGYTSKVEFALKLGYTETQIGSVLEKLGSNVDQNELLSELIKLGASHESVSTERKSQGRGGGAAGYGSSVDSVHSSDLYSDKSSSRSHPPLEQKSSGSHRDDQISNLRPIVIDGSNVAMSHGNKEEFSCQGIKLSVDFFKQYLVVIHGNKEEFSCQGIKLAVDFFKQRGHTQVIVFVPQWRKEASRNDSPITDQDILLGLEREKIVVFTPARRVGGKRVICYDDRYIIKLAAENGGIVVSNDNYRDLLNESPEFKEVIEQRLLMYSFVNDRFMPPDDPLGRHGPLLDQFLQKEPILQEPLPPNCPYNKKCTYGNKCKYYHPERGSAPHKSVTDRLKEEASLRLKQAKEKGLLTSTNSIGDTRHLASQKKPLGKTKSLVQTTQPKRALTRTRSLVPGITACTEDGGHQKLTGSSADKLDIMQRSSPASSRSLSPSLTVTPAPTDFKYNNGSGRGRRSNQVSPRQSPSPRDLSATAPARLLEAGLSVQPSQEHLSVVHDVLRPVLSDPTSGYKDFVLCQRMHGHSRLVESEDLAVADGKGVSQAFLEHGQHILTKAASASEVNEAEGQAMHRRLQRQLSLKGAEDPRILNHKAKPRDNLPTFRFHGTTVPLGAVVQQHQQQPWQLQQFVDPYRLAMYRNMQQVQLDAAAAAAAATEQQHIQRQSLSSAPAQSASEVAASDRMRQFQTNLMPPEAMRAHLPLGKMPSAPGAFVQSENRPKVGAAPRMNRQNSTSDSNLHQAKEMAALDQETGYPGIFGDPRWAFQGSISGQQVKEPFEHNCKDNKQDPVFVNPPDRFFLLPDGSKHIYQSREDLSQPGIKVEFGGRATPGAPVNQVETCKSSEQNPVRSHRGLQRTSSRNSAASGSANSRTNTVMINPNARVVAAVGNPNAQLAVGSQNVQLGSVGTPSPQLSSVGRNPNAQMTEDLNHHGQSAKGCQAQGSGTTTGRNPPSSNKGPVPQHSMKKSEQLFPPEDPRHQIFYHLAALFDERKVLQVMTAHPDETNPQVLCAYLIGMN